jgi:hypothetical protein
VPNSVREIILSNDSDTSITQIQEKTNSLKTIRSRNHSHLFKTNPILCHKTPIKKQLELNIYLGRNGGPRPGAGRPRKHSKGVSHNKREKITSQTPLHINFKYNSYIRTLVIMKLLERAIQNASRHSFIVTHFTLQSNHIHLIAETQNNKTLTSGMRSLTQ